MGVIAVLPENEIEELLATALVGRIACCAHGGEGGDGRPYVVPLSYGYDGESIYAHSGPGRKIRLMRAQPLVSFEVDRADDSDLWARQQARAGLRRPRSGGSRGAPHVRNGSCSRTISGLPGWQDATTRSLLEFTRVGARLSIVSVLYGHT